MDVHVVSGAAAAPVQSGPLPSGPLPAQPPAATQESGASQPASPATGPLAPVVAKIFGGGSSLQSKAVNVSYRVEHDPDMVVMVITDPKTGREIAQVPSEVMVQIAQFFDKEQGVTLDRSA